MTSTEQASQNGSGVESLSDEQSLDTLSTEEFLKVVGLRVRSQRAITRMSRKRLAEVSGVSERYLAQLESGQGNMSIALLRKVTGAIGMSLSTLLSAEIAEEKAVTRKISDNQAHDLKSSDAFSASHPSSAHKWQNEALV